MMLSACTFERNLENGQENNNNWARANNEDYEEKNTAQLNTIQHNIIQSGELMPMAMDNVLILR